MFTEMIASIKEDTVKYCYNVTIETKTERKEVIRKGQEKKEDVSNIEREYMAEQMGGQAPDEAEIPERERTQETVRRDHPKIGRNDPCPCGSGKKYKHCCGKNQ